MTYRWLEHCGPNYDNDLGYRTEAEFEHWKAHDPLPAYARQLAAEGVVDDVTLAQFAGAAEAEIEAAIAYAKECPWPEPEGMDAPLYAPSSRSAS